MSAAVSRGPFVLNRLIPFGTKTSLIWNLVHPGANDSTDTALLHRMALGDRDAFADFYDRHSPVLYGLALRMMGDQKEAEDVLQDAMLQLWERDGRFNEELGRPLSWAFTLVRNRAIDRLRSLQRHARIFEPPSESEEAAGDHVEGSAAESAMFSDESRLVRHALGILPVDQRQAIEMAFFGGLTQTEIAETLRQPLGTIKARIRRGMLRLRDVLEQSEHAAITAGAIKES